MDRNQAVVLETIGGGETSAQPVAKPPAGGRGGLHPFRPLLPVGVRHRGVARGSVRRIVVNGKVVSIGHHYAFPPCWPGNLALWLVDER